MHTAMLHHQAPSRPSNVLQFRLRLNEGHEAQLRRWLKAGTRMGLHDAQVAHRTPDGKSHDGYVLIWVRENPDPAYRVIPDGIRWAVVDHIRNYTLGRFATFNAALAFIRPFAPPRAGTPARRRTANARVVNLAPAQHAPRP